MSKLLLLLPLFLLAAGVLLPTSFGDLDSPKEQIESGVAPEDVTCRDKLMLVIRTSGDNDPACVTEKTADKLVERGFGILESGNNNTITPTESDDKKNTSNISRSQSSPFISDLTISHPPKLGEEAQLTLQIVDRQIRGMPDYRGVIDLPEGFELVDGILDKTEDLEADGTFEITATIKAIKTGNWTIVGGGTGGSIDVLYVAVSEDDAYLNDGHFPPPPPEPYVDTCLSEVFSVDFDEKFKKIVESIPANNDKNYNNDDDENDTSKVTRWDASLVMSSDHIITGQTANYTLTVKALDWPPNPPIRTLAVQSCNEGDVKIADPDVPLVLHYDNLADDHYYTVTGQIKPPYAGVWKLDTIIHDGYKIQNNPANVFVTVEDK